MFSVPKPRFRDLFIQDLRGNLRRLSFRGYDNEDLIKECVMYACDMCLEFQRKSEGLLSPDWIIHITNETGEAIKTLLPEEFHEQDIQTAIAKVNHLISTFPTVLQTEVDRYYNRI